MLWRVLILIALVLPASRAWRTGGASGVEAGACAPLSRAHCCDNACCCTSDGAPEAADSGCGCAVREAPVRAPEREPVHRGTGLRTGPWLALVRGARIELSDVLPAPMARGLTRLMDRVISGAPNDVKRERISVWLT